MRTAFRWGCLVLCLAGGVWCLVRLGRDSPPSQIKKAILLKQAVEARNRADLEYLWREVQSRLMEMNEVERNSFVERLRDRLETDKTAFREALDLLQDTGGPKSYELQTSLIKLVGIHDRRGRELQTGILDDAAKLSASPFGDSVFAHPFETLRPERNQITVLKTLFTYAWVLAAKEADLTQRVQAGRLAHHVQMLYAVPLPPAIKDAGLSSVALYCRAENGAGEIYFPNAGYVYGGNFYGPDQTCHGIDCSAFVSYCLETPARVSTVYLDILWREISHGESSLDVQDSAYRKAFAEQWNFLEMKNRFKAIAPGQGLKSGDVVTWRGEAGAGHSAIYLQGIPFVENEFVGIAAVRADDKSAEGIEISPYKLLKDGWHTTVLRKR